jgi:hypothetical protein
MLIAKMLSKADIATPDMGQPAHNLTQFGCKIFEMSKMTVSALPVIERQIKRNQIRLSQQVPCNFRTAVNELGAHFHRTTERRIADGTYASPDSITRFEQKRRLSILRKNLRRSQASGSSPENNDLWFFHR